MKDELEEVVERIVKEIENQDENWKGIISPSITRIGDWEEPRPDYVFLDHEDEKTLAIVCAEPNRGKDYYLEYAAKSVKLVNRHDYCLLVIPKYSSEDEVGTVIESELYSQKLANLPIGLVEYEECNGIIQSSMTRRLCAYIQRSIPRTKGQMKSYWCWWRDTSQYEVFQLLELSNKYDSYEGDIYSRYVYQEFYELMISGLTKQWNGKPRIKKYSEATFKAEKQNNKIPMVQLGLWTATEGRITNKGKKFLAIGKTYGVDSGEFFMALSKLILIDGKHLDLIKQVVDFQKKNADVIPEGSEEYFALLDEYLTQCNSMGTRKPSAVTTGAKKNYLRDEPKLWNKLGFVVEQGRGRYVKPFIGIDFDWDRINKVLLSAIDV